MDLAIGTVQFGLAYGISGRGAPVPEIEVRRILAMAFERGVRMLDTASAYGDIESRLAALCGDLPLRVVSKISSVPVRLDDAAAVAWVLAAAHRSRERLGHRLATLMFHNAGDLQGERGARIWAALAAWAESHRVAIGASCYGPDECRALQRQHGIAVAQLPANALDQRLRRAAQDGQPWPELHLRSAFLQGLLLMPQAEAVARVPDAGTALAHWHRWLAERGWSALRGALAVAKGFPAQVCVVGVESAAQLAGIVDAWDEVAALDAAELACDLPEVIDPRSWRTGA